MITEKVKQYIEENKLCSENIFYDWEAFLELLFAQGCRVESILWFEYVLVSEQRNSLGGGGYIDKTNPDYMYAETCIYKDNMENMLLWDIKEYIQSIIASYPNNKLLPSFDIVNG